MMRYQFRELSILLAGAMGQPGQRRFFISTGTPSSWVRVWLEKEQLQTLALALEEVLAEEAARASAPGDAPQEPGDEPQSEFSLGRLAVGFDRERKRVVVYLHGSDPADSEKEFLAVAHATPGQAKGFCQQALSVCSAGRPVCPLCGGPMDPKGHICSRSNGHGSFPA